MRDSIWFAVVGALLFGILLAMALIADFAELDGLVEPLCSIAGFVLGMFAVLAVFEYRNEK